MDSSEHNALLFQIRQQWRESISQPLHKEQAQAAIEALYDYADQQPPEILWVESPLAALPIATVEQSQRDCLQYELWHVLREELWHSLYRASADWNHELKQAIGYSLAAQLENSFQRSVLQTLPGEATEAVMADCLMPEWAITWAAVFEAAAHLGVEFDRDRYTLYCTYLREVGWLFPCEELAIACQRPVVYWDASDRIHAEGIPAILYPDGFGVYLYQGVRLPEQYGQLSPSQWQPQWLIEQENAELRRVLIQGIGYERICQELQATELDNWQDYSLLRIESGVDVEPVQLVKMTCPSTGLIHMLRVPPDMVSAYEAICWINWGIDPTQFAVQT